MSTLLTAYIDECIEETSKLARSLSYDIEELRWPLDEDRVYELNTAAQRLKEVTGILGTLHAAKNIMDKPRGASTPTRTIDNLPDLVEELSEQLGSPSGSEGGHLAEGDTPPDIVELSPEAQELVDTINSLPGHNGVAAKEEP